MFLPFFNVTNVTEGYDKDDPIFDHGRLGLGPILKESDTVTSYILQLYNNQLIQEPTLTFSLIENEDENQTSKWSLNYTFGARPPIYETNTTSIINLSLAEGAASELGWAIKMFSK